MNMSIRINLQKWLGTMRIYWSETLVYRVNFFLQVIGPSLVFFLIKYGLWSRIYGEHPDSLIQGYNLKQMLSYHLWVMIVGLLAQGHSSMNLSEDIRMGRITSYLIYPFNFWEFHSAQFLAFQLLQFVVTAITITTIVASRIIPVPAGDALFLGIGYSLGVGVFWFSVQYLIGLLSFWLEETWVLRVLFQMVAQFLSGAIIPLELYPTTFREILAYTPFPYLTFTPVKIFMGDFSQIGLGIFILSFWFVLVVLSNIFIWRKGLKLYSASGM